MYCTHCGKELNDNAVVCPYCGVPTVNFYGKQNAQTAAALDNTLQPQKTNVFGIVGFVIGVLSIFFGGFYCIAPAVGLVFAIVGMVKRKSCGSANGLTIAGLVICILTLVFWLFFLLILPLILEALAGLLALFFLAIFCA